MDRTKIVIIALVLFSSIRSFAQQKNFSQWTGLFHVVKVNNIIGIHFDAQFRSGDQLKDYNAILLRPGVNFTIKKNCFVTVGYALIENQRTINGASGFTPEHRIWQQAQFTHSVFFTSLSHRVRFEERFMSKYFLQDNDIAHEGYNFATRLRYFVRNVIPLNGKKQFNQGMFASIQDEVFINTGDKGAVNGKFFDQNRLMLGLGWRFSKKFDLEAAYMNQYISGKNKSFTNNHIVQLGSYVRL